MVLAVVAPAALAAGIGARSVNLYSPAVSKAGWAAASPGAQLGLSAIPAHPNSPSTQASVSCTPMWLANFGGAQGLNARVNALAVFDDGSGPALYAGGIFTNAGGAPASGIARWDGAGWSAVGGALQYNVVFSGAVFALAVFDDGGGPALYAGGQFTSAGGVPANFVAKWDGSNWSALGVGLSGVPQALMVFDDGSGPALYAGGGFNFAGLGAAKNIAKWDGLGWSALGSGANNGVYALAVLDAGSGAALYAGGEFTTAGGSPAHKIAKWDGSSWSALGSGLSHKPFALSVFDDGNGPALYAGGDHLAAGGAPAGRIAKWDGSNWSTLGSGMNWPVHALEVFNDGSGSALYAGGEFTYAGGSPASRVAKWDGANWTALGGGVDGSGAGTYVAALAAFDDGSGPALYAGGQFTTAGGAPANYIAKWTCGNTSAGSPYCTSGITTNGCAPWITGIGAASASSGAGFTLSVANVEGQKSGLLFYGVSGALASPWGTGGTSYLCVKAPTQRMSAQNSGGAAGSCDGTLSEDWNTFVTSHPNALGQPFAGGESVWAQAWFRDPAAVKTTNLSDGLMFVLQP